jgi:hypothetical protein
VDAVILFGDPYFNGGDRKHDSGSFSGRRDGVLGKRPAFNTSALVRSYCHSHDPVCQGFFFRVGPTRTPTSGRSRPSSTRTTRASASRLRRRTRSPRASRRHRRRRRRHLRPAAATARSCSRMRSTATTPTASRRSVPTARASIRSSRREARSTTSRCSGGRCT